MAQPWETELAKINRRTGTDPTGPIPTKNILAALRGSGMSDEKIAEILAGFMVTVDVKPADADTPHVVTDELVTQVLSQLITNIRDKRTHQKVTDMWATMDPNVKNEVLKRIHAMKPARVDLGFDAMVSKMRKLQPTGKPLPADYETKIMKDIPQGRFNKDWSMNTADAIYKLHGKGYNVKTLHDAWMKTNAVGRKQKSIQEMDISDS